MRDPLWEEFTVYVKDPGGIGLDFDIPMCGLCGNTGILDTRSTAVTAAGKPCGTRGHCICPNGRALKQRGAPVV